MSPQLYARLREIYAAARELDEPERDRYLEEACAGDGALRGEVESLLIDGPNGGPFLGTPVVGRLIEAARCSKLEAALPERVGSYRIVGVLGEGGMGVVYAAEQALDMRGLAERGPSASADGQASPGPACQGREHPRRRVALKVMRAGVWSPSAMRRFEHEAQVLGLLHHPGIAQIFEAGVHADREGILGPAGSCVPFFAMELVRGPSLIDFAQHHQLGTRQRLELMAKVCDAVHHAHQRGVIHRDLKPANILVQGTGNGEPGTRNRRTESVPCSLIPVPSSAQPKILDFGVARLTDTDVQLTTLQTDLGQLIGTLAYMSPEQVAGDPRALDTRSDIYSLGVILYELLCGQLPYEVRRTSLARAAQVIREEPPRRLSSADVRLRGDVETIVLKALEKDRARRYASAAELADDLRRYLADQPVTARPPTLTYQLRKLVARHQAAAASLGLFLVALATFSVVVSVLYVRSDHDRARAESAERDARTQADAAARVAASLMDLFGSLDPFGSAPGGTLVGASFSPDEILDRAATTIYQQLADQPETQVTLLNRLAEVNRSRGRYAPAERLAHDALQIARDHFGHEHVLVARSLRAVAHVLHSSYRYEQAKPLHQESLAMLRGLLGDQHPEVAMGLFRLGDLAESMGDHTAAEALLHESLTIMQAGNATDELSAGHALRSLGIAHQEQGQYDQAQVFYEQAVAAFQALGDDDLQIEITETQMATICRLQGDYGRAERLLREVLGKQRARYGDVHPWLARTLAELGETLRLRGDHAAAETCLRDAVVILRRSVGEDSPQAAAAVNYLANLMQSRGDLAETEQVRRQHLRLTEKLWGAGTWPFLSSSLALAYVLMQENKLEDSEQILRAGLDTGAQADPFRVAIEQARVAQTLAGVLVRQGKFGEAKQFAEQALEAIRRMPDGEDSAVLEVEALMTLGDVQKVYGDQVADQEYFQEAVRIARHRFGQRSRQTADALHALGGLLCVRGDYTAAEGHVREALSICRDDKGDSRQRAVAVHDLLGQVLMARGEAAAAADTFARVAATEGEISGQKRATQSARYLQWLALRAAGQLATAGTVLNDLFATQQELLLADEPDIARLHDVVLALNAVGDRQRAASLIEPVSALHERTLSLPDDHPDRSGVLMLLGLLYLGQDDASLAEPLLREAAQLRARHLPAMHHWLTPYAESLLGECLTRLERFEEAEPLLRSAAESLRRNKGPGHHRTIEVIERLIGLYERWGRHELACEYRAMLP